MAESNPKSWCNLVLKQVVHARHQLNISQLKVRVEANLMYHIML